MFNKPEDAEEAFYRAFEQSDLEMMEKIWSDDDSIVCIHPNAPRLEGHEEVMDSWRQIFESDNGLKFYLRGILSFESCVLIVLFFAR